jgi:arabinofuranan 3-O-arabinosyltransferase
LDQAFACYELPALGLAAVLLMIFPLAGAPTGFGATLIATILIARRAGPRRRRQQAPSPATNAG